MLGKKVIVLGAMDLITRQIHVRFTLALHQPLAVIVCICSMTQKNANSLTKLASQDLQVGLDPHIPRKHD